MEDLKDACIRGNKKRQEYWRLVGAHDECARFEVELKSIDKRREEAENQGVVGK